MNKKYKVEVNVERGKDTYLSVTHNGHQWSSINIREPEIEIPIIIDALQRHLTSKKRCTCHTFPHKHCPIHSKYGNLIRHHRKV